MHRNLSVCSFIFLLSMIIVVNAGPLHDAAKIGDMKAISAALDKGADVNESDGIATPLYLAVAGGHVEAVKQLQPYAIQRSLLRRLMQQRD
jgi:cytochrome c